MTKAVCLVETHMSFDSIQKETRPTHFCPVCSKIVMIVQNGLKSVILPHFSRQNGVLTGCDGNGREIDD
ncbi:MAG: hypothetical protein WC880_00300 [Candidatus Paceibacterota bacterium]